jgi:putative transposase
LHRFVNAGDPNDSQRKRQFIFKRDPRDISEIYFYDPELKQYFRIPYRDTSHPAISLWELREVRRQLEQEGRENVDENLIFEAYERMRRQEEKAVRETKKVRRSRQRRDMHQHIVPRRHPRSTRQLPIAAFSPQNLLPISPLSRRWKS